MTNNMTKTLMIKKLLITLLAFALFIPTTFAATFSDVPEDHIHYVAIESLYNLEIIDGYPDGSFKPGNSVNRAEALKMVLNSAEISSAEVFTNTGFPDVPYDSWFARYVVKGNFEGIINGNPDGTFAPERLVNKAEFVKMLLEAFNMDLAQHYNITEAVAVDTQPGDWYAPYFSYAKTVGIIFPTMNDELEPEKFLTRGECADIIYKLLVIEKGGDTQKLLSIAEANLVSVLIELNNNNIQKALNYANSAVFFTEKALEAEPEEGIVKAANKIALGFHKLTLAYQAGLEERYDDLTQYVNEAKDLAGQAYDDDPSTQALGQKIKEQGDILLQQVE